MAERVSPYRAKAPEAVLDLIRKTATSRFYLVQRPGPTSFVLREGDSEDKHRVLVGVMQMCSCGGGAEKPGKAGGELCIHIVFVMVKVLGVPHRNPIVWQLSLIDKEVDEALKCRPPMGAKPTLASGGGASGASTQQKRRQSRGSNGEVPQRNLEDDATCPICYETMAGVGADELVYCAFGCGNNVHGRCMRIWAEHQHSIGKDLTCPMCRREWGPFYWTPPKVSRTSAAARRQQSTLAPHHGVSCGACRASPIAGARFRCLICRHLDLCASCFGAGAHPEHPFALRETPSSSEELADRPSTPTPRSKDETSSENVVNINSSPAASKQRQDPERPTAESADSPACEGEGSEKRTCSSRRVVRENVGRGPPTTARRRPSQPTRRTANSPAQNSARIPLLDLFVDGLPITRHPAYPLSSGHSNTERSETGNHRSPHNASPQTSHPAPPPRKHNSESLPPPPPSLSHLHRVSTMSGTTPSQRKTKSMSVNQAMRTAVMKGPPRRRAKEAQERTATTAQESEASGNSKSDLSMTKSISITSKVIWRPIVAPSSAEEPFASERGDGLSREGSGRAIPLAVASMHMSGAPPPSSRMQTSKRWGQALGKGGVALMNTNLGGNLGHFDFQPVGETGNGYVGGGGDILFGSLALQSERRRQCSSAPTLVPSLTVQAYEPPRFVSQGLGEGGEDESIAALASN